MPSLSSHPIKGCQIDFDNNFQLKPRMKLLLEVAHARSPGCGDVDYMVHMDVRECMDIYITFWSCLPSLITTPHTHTHTLLALVSFPSTLEKKRVG